MNTELLKEVLGWALHHMPHVSDSEREQIKEEIKKLDIVSAAREVCKFDWSDSDADAAATIERLRNCLDKY